LLLRHFRRRELAWVTIPAIAAVFTLVAYLAGLGLHGGVYQDDVLEVLRAGPDGVVGATDFHGIYTPRRGDFAVQLATSTLGSTALSPFASTQTGQSASVS